MKTINCTPKLNIPIRIPKRQELLSIIDELRPKIVNIIFPTEEIIDVIGVFIGSRFNIDVVHHGSLEVENNSIGVNAFYDSGLDEVNEVPIEIILLTNPSDDFINLEDDEFNDLAIIIAECICHEMIHMKQSRSRDFLEVTKLSSLQAEDDFVESQLYLSDPNEIDANAFSIAEELSELPDLYKKLENPLDIDISESIKLWAYIHAFARDMSHPVLKRLLKKIYKNLKKR